MKTKILMIVFIFFFPVVCSSFDPAYHWFRIKNPDGISDLFGKKFKFDSLCYVDVNSSTAEFIGLQINGEHSDYVYGRIVADSPRSESESTSGACPTNAIILINKYFTHTRNEVRPPSANPKEERKHITRLLENEKK